MSEAKMPGQMVRGKNLEADCWLDRFASEKARELYNNFLKNNKILTNLPWLKMGFGQILSNHRKINMQNILGEVVRWLVFRGLQQKFILIEDSWRGIGEYDKESWRKLNGREKLR